MNNVFIISDNIISPIGDTTAANFAGVKQGISGIRQVENNTLKAKPFFASAFIEKVNNNKTHTAFEELCIRSIENALSNCKVSLADRETIFILSTTKGNIALLETEALNEEVRTRIALQHTARTIGAYFKAASVPVVVSNACISGVLAIMVAKRLIQSGKYKHAVVTGADVLSRFVIAGFQSLHAISAAPCKPFDKTRDGISLGEGAATVVLSTEESFAGTDKKVLVHEGASSNDANHISGPSRTGNELAFAVQSAIGESKVANENLAFISAHGTATVYNDEMESKAFETCGLGQIPLFSLKGNYGHTLGAAGVIESVLTIQSLKEGLVLPSANYNERGVSGNVTVNKTLAKTSKKHALKTASGFGGCNAAIIYSLI